MSGFDTLLSQSTAPRAEQARALGLPTSRVERWKYVPTRTLTRTAWVAPTPRNTDTFALSGGQFFNLPAIDGLTEVHSGLTDAERSRLDVMATAHGFSLTQDALNSHQLIVEVHPSTTVTLALEHLANLSREAGFATLVIRVGANASVALIETFEADAAADTNLDSLRVLLSVARDGRVNHLKFQAANAGQLIFHAVDVDLHENAHYTLDTIDFGSKMARSDISVTLSGRHASADVRGLALCNGAQYHDTHLSIDHAVGETTSAMMFRNMVDDKGEATFNGRVLIQADAQRSATEQSVANLLLSDRARVNPKPELEIYADDVTASHGCTVGSLNQTELFYLKSRGIAEADARAFLQYAFAEEVVARVVHPEIREQIETRLLGELTHGELIAELKDALHV
jgi:Fe-S cluster assembly protein SufD